MLAASSTRGFVPPVGRTFSEILRQRSSEQPDRAAFTYLVDGESEEVRLTFAELDRRARAIAVSLVERGLSGERALLLFPPGLEFVTAFFGCLHAGVVAVPAYPPMQARQVGRLSAIVADCSPRAVLTTSMLRDIAQPMLGLDPSVDWIPVDTVPSDAAERWCAPVVDPDDVAFLQYTSGSTGQPKGVRVTHTNLVHNGSLIQNSARTDADATFVGWLPLYHDMGLIGNVLHPLYVGSSCVLMSPLAFLERPMRWLRAVSRFQARVSGGPNFAYDLCARRVTPAEVAALDLFHWRVAFNGAEPVRVETMDRFAEVFGPAGFRKEVYFPCYGLAEATLLVTGGGVARVEVRSTLLQRGAITDGTPDDRRTLVSCGTTRADQQVVIVAPDTRVRCASHEVGEIWTRSDSVARGYWNRPDESERTFGAVLAGEPGQTYLRTGDLGFVRDSELYVTGRLKDLIIVRGRNYYPQDLEETAEGAHPDVRPGCSAAFSVDGDGEEQVVLVVEVRSPAAHEAVVAAVRQAVAEQHELHVQTVVSLAPRTIPKTSSGKIQRRECRTAFLAGELAEVGRTASTSPVVTRTAIEQAERRSILLLPTEERNRRIEDLVTTELARVLRIDPATIGRSTPLATLGLDSMMALDATDGLETVFGVSLDSAVLWRHPTVAEMATWLVGTWVRAAVFAPPAAADADADHVEFDL